MQRRTLLKIAALSGVAMRGAFPLRVLADGLDAAASGVHTVLLVTKCHLDVGFTKTQAIVKQLYFDIYFPAAIKTATDLRAAGGDRYIWTTGSWLLYEYLEQASSAQRKVIEAAIAASDLNWHAVPFTWQTEMIDSSMIKGGLGLSAELDRRFGHKTISGKLTDVPGHTRGIIAPLSQHGVRLLDVGGNPSTMQPELPEVFLWKDASGDSLAVLYHRHDYGGTVVIPGTGIAVAVEVRNDNSGPHSLEEIAAIYARLRAQFPAAQVKASNLNEVAVAVDQVRSHLPIVTAEIGDTWIYGCASDPLKVSRYREMARLRQQWIASNAFASGDETDRNLLRFLMLVPEHTWGTDTKTYLDYKHYRSSDLEQVLSTPPYVVMQSSWNEKRDNIVQGVRTLPPMLAQLADAQLAKLVPVRPVTTGMKSHAVNDLLETRHFHLQFDEATGAIVQLENRSTHAQWATTTHPLALFTYQTLSAEDYASFIKRFCVIDEPWVQLDNGKPGIDAFGAITSEWHPRLTALWTMKESAGDRVLAELNIVDAKALATGNIAWPEQMFLEAFLPSDQPRIDLTLSTFLKIENRMPEAMWLTFAPANADPKTWRLEKVEQWIDPMDVVSGGGRSMHALTERVVCENALGTRFDLHALDAPVVAVGKRTPLNFTVEQPDLSSGIHFSLFNNAWGTNYPQWCGGNWMYRFHLHLA